MKQLLSIVLLLSLTTKGYTLPVSDFLYKGGDSYLIASTLWIFQLLIIIYCFPRVMISKKCLYYLLLTLLLTYTYYIVGFILEFNKYLQIGITNVTTALMVLHFICGPVIPKAIYLHIINDLNQQLSFSFCLQQLLQHPLKRIQQISLIQLNQRL